MPAKASPVVRNLHTLVGERQHNDLGATLVPCPWRERKAAWGRVAWLILVVAVCIMVVWLCGCVLCCVLILCCVDCRVEYPKLVEHSPQKHLGGNDLPRTPSTCNPHLNKTRIHMCLEPGKEFINRITATGAYMCHRFLRASFKLNNFLNFCPFATFDSSKI
jgi:hypothetical protein